MTKITQNLLKRFLNKKMFKGCLVSLRQMTFIAFFVVRHRPLTFFIFKMNVVNSLNLLKNHSGTIFALIFSIFIY